MTKNELLERNQNEKEDTPIIRKKVRHINDYKEEIKVKNKINYSYFILANEIVDYGRFLFDSANERIVYETLIRYGNNNEDLAKAGLRTLSKNCIMSRPTLIKNLNLLHKKGYIEIIETEGYNQTNIYHIFDIKDFITKEMLETDINEKSKSYSWDEDYKEEKLNKLMIRYGFEKKEQQCISLDEQGCKRSLQGGKGALQGGKVALQGGKVALPNKELPLKELSLKELSYSFLENVDLKPSTIKNINNIDGLTEEFFNFNYNYLLNNENIGEGLLVKRLQEGKRLGADDLAKKKEKESEEIKKDLQEERNIEENKEILEEAIELYRIDIGVKSLNSKQIEAFNKFSRSMYIKRVLSA